jgi:hypothetical protein
MTDHEVRDSSSDNIPSPTLDKEPVEQVEQVHTNERVPGHPGYYEKDGLRTYGDDENHDVEPPVSFAGVPLPSIRTDWFLDDRVASIELGGNGFLVDWVADPSVPSWWCTSIRKFVPEAAALNELKTHADLSSQIYSDLGGVDRWIWFVLAYLLALAAICPFVGSISDLIGRRWVSLGGSGLLVIAMAVCGTAKNMNIFISKSPKI